MRISAKIGLRFGVPVLLLILGISQLAYGDGTVTANDGDHDLLNIGLHPAPDQFYVTFIDISQASVTLSSGVFKFTITVQSTPSDWLDPAWHPTFGLPSQPPIQSVGYRWFLYGPSGDLLAVVRVTWVDGTVIRSIRICPPDTLPQCETTWVSVGVGSLIYRPSSMTASFSQPTNSIWTTIPQEDLFLLFSSNGLPNPVAWRARTFACSSPETANPDASCGPFVVDQDPDQALSLLPT